MTHLNFLARRHPYIAVMAFFQTKHLWVKALPDGVAVLVLDREQNAFNFLDQTLLDDLERALDAVAKADDTRLLVIRSAKTTNFCHGPGPGVMGKWKPGDFPRWSERGQAVCAKLSDLPIPSMCVISGACFDAGLELALACDYRVVVNRVATTLGFPELEWGMIPCWGGTQRLPRLIGLESSLQMLLAGQQFDAREAWLLGLADHLEEEVNEEPPAFLERPVKRDWSRFPTQTWRQRWLESNRPGRWFLFRGAERILRTRVPEDMPAQGEMLTALRVAYHSPTSMLAGGLEFERQAVARIVAHPALHHLLRLLVHREDLRPPGRLSRNELGIHRVGVLGVDTAGLALLLQSVVKGYEVVMRAEDELHLGAGLTQIVQLLQTEVQRGAKSHAHLQKTLGVIRGTFTWNHFDKLDLILDTEDGALADKQALYQEMEKEIAPDVLIVPVTGLHRIEDLRQGLKHPRRVIGLHLIEPWNRGSIAEVVGLPGVSRRDVQRVREWAIELGKCCLDVPDQPPGVMMRVWLPALNEAALLVKEGVPIDSVDFAMRRFGMTFGPLEWMDRLGIDHVARLIDAARSSFADRISFETGFSLMVQQQWLGKRSGEGFYHRVWKKLKPHRPTTLLWRTQSQGEDARPVPALSERDSQAWIQNRLITLMILESVRCLQEGLIQRADDLDCAMCLTGWATHRGGPIGYARHLGAESLTACCEALAATHGARYAPIESLQKVLGE